MNRVYVSIGSNIDRARHVTVALDALHDWFAPLLLSSVYESEAVGFSGESFYNLVAGFDTALPVRTLNQRFKALEQAHGRRHSDAKFSARTLDIDILTYADRSGVVDGVELPRGEILQHAFVLGPLAEIAPHDTHPACGETYAALWQQFRGERHLWPVDFDWREQRISDAQP